VLYAFAHIITRTHSPMQLALHTAIHTSMTGTPMSRSRVLASSVISFETRTVRFANYKARKKIKSEVQVQTKDGNGIATRPKAGTFAQGCVQFDICRMLSVAI
jgi:hypothetical protein